MLKRNTNLSHIGEHYYNVPYENLTENAKGYYTKEEYEEESYSVNYEDIEDFDNIDYSTDYFYFEEDFREFVEELFKTYPYYLQVTLNETWNGASGYNITIGKDNLLNLGYETTMYFQAQSKHRKSTHFRVHSHDNPTGFDYLIIGLTENGYERLNGKDTQDMIEYAQEVCKSLLEQ